MFLCLPHGASQSIVPKLLGQVRWVVDVAADFRLHDAALYPEWYGEAHAAPDLLDSFVYGLPELFRDQLDGASAVAVPGCYPTASILTLAPLVHGGLIEPTGIIVDAACGASGAGRPPKPNTTFCTVDEDFTAYGLLTHRHTPEIEQAVSGPRGWGPATSGAVHPAPGSDEPGHPGHLLRPGPAGSPPPPRCSRPARGLRRRAVRGRHRGIAVHQGHPRHQLAHITARFDARTGTVRRHRRPSTTSSRAPPARRSSA